MSDNYSPYVALVLTEESLVRNTAKDALVKAVQMGVSTEPFRCGEFASMQVFEQELLNGTRHIDGVVVLIDDYDLVVHHAFRDFLKAAANYGVRRYVFVYNSIGAYDDDDDGFAESEIRDCLDSLGCDVEQFSYIVCPVTKFLDCGEAEQYLDAMRPFVVEINNCIVSPAMLSNDFRMPIKQVFSIKNVGVVAVGVVIHGSLRAGDEVVIIGGRKPIKAKAVRFELCRQMVDSVAVGDDTGVFLEGVSANEIDAGMMIITL